MGQKVNPHGLRVGVIKDWDSRWYARNEKVGDLLVEDNKIRNYLKKTLYSAGIPRIEIERDNAKVRIYLHCARPGVVIGKGGTEIERIRLEVEKMIGPDTDFDLLYHFFNQRTYNEQDSTIQAAYRVVNKLSARQAFCRPLSAFAEKAQEFALYTIPHFGIGMV